MRHEMITCKPPNHQCIWVLVLPVTCPKLNFFKHLFAKIWDDFLPALDKIGLISANGQDNDWSMDSDDSPAKMWKQKVPQIAWPGLGSMIHHDSWPKIIRLCNSRNLSWDLAGVTQNCEGDFYPPQNDSVRRRSIIQVVEVVLMVSELRWRFSLHPPKFKSSPLKKWWLEEDPFLLGFGLFSGAFCC